MLCKFCKKEKKLRNSHIIPEFFYKHLYDEKHKMIVIDTKKKKFSDKWKIQKGIREHLLCDDCENYFNREFENKFNIHWYDQNNCISSISINSEVVISVDSELLQKLLLSILWRASVSSHRNFKYVNLGQKHEESIRQILLGNQDPFHHNSYEIWGTAITHEDGVVIHDLVCPPLSFKIESHQCYATIFGGIQWYIKVSSHRLNFIKNYKLTKNSNLRVIQESWHDSAVIYQLNKLKC